MATLKGSSRISRAIGSKSATWRPAPAFPQRWSSSEAAAKSSAPNELSDLEPGSSFGTPAPDASVAESFHTARKANQRSQELPGNRYQYHPPKYDRGPLHPIQPLPSSDPTARNHVPGPFNNPRIKQTFDATVASDLMILGYRHHIPGTPDREPRERLRPWDDSSPYHKNRPRRGPRGATSLDLLEKDITFRNIPEIKSVSINAFAPRAGKMPIVQPVTRSVIQALTGVTPTTLHVKHTVQQWRAKEGDKSGVKATIYGNQALEFVDKLVNIVLPNIKEWPGVKGSTGDRNGNLALGLRPEDLVHFPELAVNWDMYPAKLMPGCDIFIHTTATSDRHARWLLQSMGLPFYGKVRLY